MDDFGNVKRKANIAYGRQQSANRITGQEALWATLTEADFFNSEDPSQPSVDWYRAGVPIEQRAFELTGVDGVLNGAPLIHLDALERAHVVSGNGAQVI